jgi:hypothetical protein
MTDAEMAGLIRTIARGGYSIWNDTDGSTAKRLILIAQRLEASDK